MAKMESLNKQYLVQINQLHDENDQRQLAMDTVSAKLNEERNTTLLAVAQLRNNNLLLSPQN